MSDILFLHGLESGPTGTKATWLARRYGACTPQMDTSSFARAVADAERAIHEHQPRFLVGSSFGGAIAVKLVAEGAFRGPVVLVAPAARRLGVADALPADARVIVIHGELDDIVPLADSRDLVAGAGSGVELWEIPGGDHRLNRILEDGTLDRALAAVGAPLATPGQA